MRMIGVDVGGTFTDLVYCDMDSGALAIESNIVQRHDGPTVVVTHHAPHPLSVRERFGSDLLAGAYGSDLSELI